MVKQSRPTKKARANAEQSAFVQRAKELGIEIVGKRAFVTTSRGVRVECMPIAHVIESITSKTRNEFVEKSPEPSIPTYRVEGAPGTFVDVAYDEKTIENDDVPQEAKDAWIDHVAWQTALKQEFGQVLIRTMAVMGVGYDYPDDDEWIKDAEYVGLEVPKDPRERRVFYFSTFILGNRNDGYTISQGIYAASGFNEALNTTIEDSFQS